MCPSTFGFDNSTATAGDYGLKQDALSFARVCTTWRDVGIARYWRHVSVPWRGPAQAPVLVARSAQGLIRELSVNTHAADGDVLSEQVAVATVSVARGLRALFIIVEARTLEPLLPALASGAFASLVDFHVALYDFDGIDIEQVYEALAHMPHLEYFDCGVGYRSATSISCRPRVLGPRRRLARLSLRLEPHRNSSMEHRHVEQDILTNLLYFADLSCLRELRLHYSLSHALPAQLTPHLSQLRILRLGVPAILFPSFPVALVSILAGLPSLGALDVRILASESRRTAGVIASSDAFALLAALPLSLEVALLDFDFSQQGSFSHLSTFLTRRLADGVLKRWTSGRGTTFMATLNTTWRRCDGGGGEEHGGARWESEDFEESFFY